MDWLWERLWPKTFYCWCGNKVPYGDMCESRHSHHRIGSLVLVVNEATPDIDMTRTRSQRLRTFCDGTDHA